MRMQQIGTQGPIAGHPLHEATAPDPVPAVDEIVLAVSACAVCRTDLQLCEGEIAARHLPFVPGHQIIGTVVAVGRDVDAWKEGDRAGAAWLAGACGRCERCREGRENLCPYAEFTGWDRDGGYATHVKVRASFALNVPAIFDDLQAAPLLCGGIIGYRALKVSGVRPGQRLGLYGFGASALLTLQVARHWNCRVFVCTRSQAERQRALSLGAEWAGGYDDPPPEPLDAAITTAPAGRVVIAALRALDRGGTVAINAIHLDGIPAFPYAPLWWERSLRSVANFTRADAREFLEIASEIPIRPIVEVHPLEQANAALESLKAGTVGGAAVLRC
jgi:propanol-preferring alcohol dehydrogenase